MPEPKIRDYPVIPSEAVPPGEIWFATPEGITHKIIGVDSTTPTVDDLLETSDDSD